MPSKRTPVVLVTNDDGPPCDESPFIYRLVQLLNERLGWQTRVVIPDSQKSWISSAYMIKEKIEGEYFYPEGPDGRKGKKSKTRIDSQSKKEWILLSGTPATCANIALNNLYPGEIDLCISGPNYGRNTSNAFAVSSGTVGAAMSASLTGVPSIALSYGIFQKPIADEIVEKCHDLAIAVIEQLWQAGFPEGVFYNVNVPLLPGVLEQQKEAVRWTTLAEKTYGRLFKPSSEAKEAWSGDGPAEETKKAGPAAISVLHDEHGSEPAPAQVGDRLSFRFAPDLGPLIRPDAESLVDGSDIHTISNCLVSVTPLRAALKAGEIPTTLKAWKL